MHLFWSVVASMQRCVCIQNNAQSHFKFTSSFFYYFLCFCFQSFHHNHSWSLSCSFFYSFLFLHSWWSYMPSVLTKGIFVFIQCSFPALIKRRSSSNLFSAHPLFLSSCSIHKAIRTTSIFHANPHIHPLKPPLSRLYRTSPLFCSSSFGWLVRLFVFIFCGMWTVVDFTYSLANIDQLWLLLRRVWPSPSPPSQQQLLLSTGTRESWSAGVRKTQEQKKRNKEVSLIAFSFIFFLFFHGLLFLFTLSLHLCWLLRLSRILLSSLFFTHTMLSDALCFWQHPPSLWFFFPSALICSRSLTHYTRQQQ